MPAGTSSATTKDWQRRERPSIRCSSWARRSPRPAEPTRSRTPLANLRTRPSGMLGHPSALRVATPYTVSSWKDEFKTGSFDDEARAARLPDPNSNPLKSRRPLRTYPLMRHSSSASTSVPARQASCHAVARGYLARGGPAAQLECVLGPGWQTYTRSQVEDRARE